MSKSLCSSGSLSHYCPALLNLAIPFLSPSKVGPAQSRLATSSSRCVLHSFLHVSSTLLRISSVDFSFSRHIWAHSDSLHSERVPLVLLLHCCVCCLDLMILLACFTSFFSLPPTILEKHHLDFSHWSPNPFDNIMERGKGWEGWL